jgi:hypothetical protein
METRILEVRDHATFIPVLCIRVSGVDGYLMRRAGFGEFMVEVIHLTSQKCAYDPYDWGNRTMQEAHLYISQHWNELSNEDVIDVAFILGETKHKKLSERVTA